MNISFASRRVGRGVLLGVLSITVACSSQAPPVTATTITATKTATAPHGMVVSASSIASEAGRDVLAHGGNAVDAAIATGFALAVTYPAAGNIGGGGFMVIRFPDGRATTIDFRERAPAAATPEMFTDSAGNYSAMIHHRSLRAVGVPGTVAGFALAHEKYGKARWSDLVNPAVTLAGEGFAAPPGLAGSLSNAVARLKQYPATVEAYSNHGQPYAIGDRIRLPDLARTLARIRDQGRDGFYTGETAHLIAAEMQRGGGLITEQDLAQYQAKERAPIRGTPIAGSRSSPCRRRARAASRSSRCSTSSRATTSARWATTRRSTCTTWPRRCGVRSSIGRAIWVIPTSPQRPSIV